MATTEREIERRFTGEMATLDKTGDTKIMWDKDNPDEVENAEYDEEALLARANVTERAG